MSSGGPTQPRPLLSAADYGMVGDMNFIQLEVVSRVAHMHDAYSSGCCALTAAQTADSVDMDSS